MPNKNNMEEKQCSTCKKVKILDEFANPKASYCKNCSNIYASIWRKKNKEKIKGYTQRQIKMGQKHCLNTIQRAIKKGILPRLTTSDIKCVFCKKNRATVYEYRDYNKPLEVKPACRSCNGKIGSAPIRVKTGRIYYKKNQLHQK